MTELVWDASGAHKYELGVDRGVLYPMAGPGITWEGLVSVAVRAANRSISTNYLDGIKYVDNVVHAGDFEATITAFEYPYEFFMCDGALQLGAGLLVTQQRRESFHLCYRTLIGNELEGESLGYKLHLIYNARTSPTAISSKTLSDQTDITASDRLVNATPVEIPGRKPTPYFVVDSTKSEPGGLAELEDILYGTSSSPPQMPDPALLAELVVLI